MTGSPPNGKKRDPLVGAARRRMRRLMERGWQHSYAMRSLLVGFTILSLVPAGPWSKAAIAILPLLLALGLPGGPWIAALLAGLAVASYWLAPLQLLIGGGLVLLLGGIGAGNPHRFPKLGSYQLQAIGFGVLYAALFSIALSFVGFHYWPLHVLLGLYFVLRTLKESRASRQLLPDYLHTRSVIRSEGARITLLRRFSSEYSDIVKNVIVPLLQGFGPVELVGDRTLDHADYHGRLSVDLAAMPGLLKMSERRFTHEEWKQKVEEILRKTDVAVIDISEPTDSLIWEMAHCYNLLQQHRIILLIGVDALATRSLEEHVTEVLQKLSAHDVPGDVGPIAIVYDARTVDGQFTLGEQLTQAMSHAIEVERTDQPQ